MRHRFENDLEESHSRAQRIDALVGHQASLTIDRMFAVPPFPAKNDHFVPQLSRRKTQFLGLGIINNFSETNIDPTGEEVNGVKKPSILNVKKTLIDNGAVIKDDVILREIRRDIMDYYYPNNEIEDNYLHVILSSGESVLARTKKSRYTLGTS
jgi:hypothetical protein